MAKYSIPMYGTVSASVEVEAEDYETAVEQALENAPQTDFGFAQFDGVEDWSVSDDYYRDGEWINTDNPTHGD